MDERRQQLVALGLELFGERNYDDISIDEIAQRAGISKGLLYHYFPSKRHFYVDTVRAAARQLLEETEVHVEGVAALDALREGLSAYLSYVDRHATAYSALLRSGIGADPEVLEIVEDTRNAFVARLLAGLGVGLAEAPPPLRAALRGWVGMVEAASLDWIDHRDLTREQMHDLFFDMAQRAVDWASGR